MLSSSTIGDSCKEVLTWTFRPAKMKKTIFSDRTLSANAWRKWETNWSKIMSKFRETNLRRSESILGIISLRVSKKPSLAATAKLSIKAPISRPRKEANSNVWAAPKNMTSNSLCAWGAVEHSTSRRYRGAKILPSTRWKTHTIKR